MRPKGVVSEKRVREVKRAAAELFSTRGYLETSMDEIAGAARLSKGGLYHYFNSKTEILSEVLSDFMDCVLEDIENDLESMEGAEGRLSRLIRRHVEIYVEHMHEARILLKEANNLPSKDLKVIEEKERRYFTVAAGIVRGFLGASAGKDIITAVTFSLLGMCNWIFSWYDPAGPVSPGQLSDIILSIFTSGARSAGEVRSGTSNAGSRE